MASGKDSPFGMDGKSVEGNSGDGYQGMKNQRGPDKSQKMGPNDRNPSSIPAGGPVLKLDPKGNRDGLVSQTAAGGMSHKPFKLGQPAMPAENADLDDAGPAGDLDAADMT